jgi:two-component system response regulator GlrR
MVTRSLGSIAPVRCEANQGSVAGQLIGTSPVFVAMLEQLRCFAAIDVPVLILGETGTGKELAARTIHYLSRRVKGPLISVNCGALPDHLLENELFGHGKGAYTDAREASFGLVAQAQGGTLFLDEVDGLAMRAQVALLRFLQDRRYRPLGAAAECVADVRTIAASNTRLDELAACGRFRQDLLFRLDVASVVMPPLRDRPEDIISLARHFLAKAAAMLDRPRPELGDDAVEKLCGYHWPGNVRELENVMLRALLTECDVVRTLPLGTCRQSTASSAADDFSGGLKVARARRTRAFEQGYLAWLLRQTAGNVSAAARVAGTERRHLGRLIARHGIDLTAYRAP